VAVEHRLQPSDYCISPSPSPFFPQNWANRLSDQRARLDLFFFLFFPPMYYRENQKPCALKLFFRTFCASNWMGWDCGTLIIPPSFPLPLKRAGTRELLPMVGLLFSLSIRGHCVALMSSGWSDPLFSLSFPLPQNATLPLISAVDVFFSSFPSSSGKVPFQTPCRGESNTWRFVNEVGFFPSPLSSSSELSREPLREKFHLFFSNRTTAPTHQSFPGNFFSFSFSPKRLV